MQFLLFSTIFSISLNLESNYIFILLKVVVQLIVFLSSANLICQSTDISKCFIESLGFRDNESTVLEHTGLGNSVDPDHITKTCLFKYTENFTTKNWKFSDKKSDNFHIPAQNIDCGYSLELPCRGSSNENPQSILLSRNQKNNVYPCKPQFYYIEVGFKGVKII